MIQYEQHPLGACYPPLTSEEFAKLKAGLRDPAKPPAILFEGKVLDGWHYYKACLEEGVEARFESPKIANPFEFVVRRNEGRRQLTKVQRAEIALKMANVKKHSNQFAQKVVPSNEGTSAITQRRAAQLLGVSEASVTRAQQIRDGAISEVKAALKAGVISQGRADVMSRMSEEEQRTELAQWSQKKVAKRKQTERRNKNPNPKKAMRKGYFVDTSIKLATTAEDGFPVNGTLEEKDAYYKKYGRTPLFAKDVKDIMNDALAVDGYVQALLTLTNDMHPSATEFFAKIDRMLAWVQRPEKGDGWQINQAAKARKSLAYLKERLPIAVARVNELNELWSKRK